MQIDDKYKHNMQTIWGLSHLRLLDSNKSSVLMHPQELRSLFRGSGTFSGAQEPFQELRNLLRDSGTFSGAHKPFQELRNLFRRSGTFSRAQEPFQELTNLVRSSGTFYRNSETFTRIFLSFKKGARTHFDRELWLLLGNYCNCWVEIQDQTCLIGKKQTSASPISFMGGNHVGLHLHLQLFSFWSLQILQCLLLSNVRTLTEAENNLFKCFSCCCVAVTFQVEIFHHLQVLFGMELAGGVQHLLLWIVPGELVPNFGPNFRSKST